MLRETDINRKGKDVMKIMHFTLYRSKWDAAQLYVQNIWRRSGFLLTILIFYWPENVKHIVSKSLKK